MTGNEFPNRSTETEVDVNCSLIGTDLNVTVAVLHVSVSGDAADGAKGHLSTFRWP